MKLPSKRREQAAQLLAEDRFPDRKIAELCGISEQSLNKWKQRPEFSARVQELIAIYAERALKFGLARRERRLTVLSDMHDRILSVIEERSADPCRAGPREISDRPDGLRCRFRRAPAGARPISWRLELQDPAARPEPCRMNYSCASP